LPTHYPATAFFEFNDSLTILFIPIAGAFGGITIA